MSEIFSWTVNGARHVHLDPHRLAELRARVEQEVVRRGLASCQYALALDGAVVVTETFGDAPPGARYVVFSATKIVPVAVVWQLLGEGLLDLDAPVVRWWPEFGRHGKEAITVADVLAHRAGLPSRALPVDAVADRTRRVAGMEAWEPEWEPGSRFEYHPFSAHWILVELIARVTGLDHRDAVRERLLDPLGLERLELGVPPERQGDVLPLVPTGEPATVDDLADELGPEVAQLLAPMLDGLAGDPMDDPTIASLFTPTGLASGIPGAGAVSDAADLALLYQALLHDTGGLWEPDLLADLRQRVVSTEPHLFGVPAMRGLGIEISGEGPDHERRHRIGSGATSPATFGHSGAGGQIAWADPATGLSFAFVTNAWDRNPVEVMRRDRAIDEHVARCVVR